MPWNPVIKACLNAIDEHVALYLETGEQWHLAQAQVLREYIAELKEWIQRVEGETGKK